MRITFKTLIMAVIYTATVGGFSYGFDFADQRIDVDALITTCDATNLWTAIKEAQASLEGVVYSQAATAEGLTPLSTGISTFLTVSLLDNWEINTLKSSGKFEIAGGNIVRDDESDPFRDNPLITYINNLSQAGVVAESGISGLTPEESAKLDTIDDLENKLNFLVNKSRKADKKLDGIIATQ